MQRGGWRGSDSGSRRGPCRPVAAGSDQGSRTARATSNARDACTRLGAISPTVQAENHAEHQRPPPTTRRSAPHVTIGQWNPTVATRDRPTTWTPARGDHPHLSPALMEVRDVTPLDMPTAIELNTVIRILFKGQVEIEGANARLLVGLSVLGLLLLGGRICAVARVGAPGARIRRVIVIGRLRIVSPILAVLGLFVGWGGPWGSGALTRPPLRRSSVNSTAAAWATAGPASRPPAATAPAAEVPMPPTTPLLDLRLHRVSTLVPMPPMPPAPPRSQCPRLLLDRARIAARRRFSLLRPGPGRGRS